MTEGNNFSRKNSQLRDSFLTESELEYFEELINDKKCGKDERRLHSDLLRESADDLCKTAQRLIDRVERGEFNDEEMEYVEYVILHCLKAVEDAEMVHGRVLGKEPEEDVLEHN